MIPGQGPLIAEAPATNEMRRYGESSPRFSKSSAKFGGRSRLWIAANTRLRVLERSTFPSDC